MPETKLQKCKRDRTKEKILKGIKKIEGNGGIVLLKNLSELVGCTAKNLGRNYLEFIKANCNGDVLVYDHKYTSPYQTTSKQREWLDSWGKFDNKAFGIGIEEVERRG